MLFNSYDFQDDNHWYYKVDWWYNFDLPTHEHEIYYTPSVFVENDPVVLTKYVMFDV